MIEEKRRYPWLKIGHKVEWKKVVDFGQSLPSKSDITRNASEGGICLFVNEKFERGDVFDLAIGLPGNNIIHARGQVRWVKEVDAETKKYEIGFEFLKISNSDREELKKIIFKFLPYQSKS